MFIYVMGGGVFTTEDVGGLPPTASTIMKKAKSRMMDKDGRSRNRLSHTLAPLYYAKSKRPAPTDLDGAGVANRVGGGQQPQQPQQPALSRRQRSVQTKGKSSRRTFFSRLYFLLFFFLVFFFINEATYVCKHQSHLFYRSKQSSSARGNVQLLTTQFSFPPAGGRSIPSLSGLHIVETNQEIPVKSCVTRDSCRYTGNGLKNKIN